MVEAVSRHYGRGKIEQQEMLDARSLRVSCKGTMKLQITMVYFANVSITPVKGRYRRGCTGFSGEVESRWAWLVLGCLTT